MGIEEAIAIIEQEKIARVEACRQQIEQALKDHKCRIEASMLITAAGAFPQISIVAE